MLIPYTYSRRIKARWAWPGETAEFRDRGTVNLYIQALDIKPRDQITLLKNKPPLWLGNGEGSERLRQGLKSTGICEQEACKHSGTLACVIPNPRLWVSV